MKCADENSQKVLKPTEKAKRKKKIFRKEGSTIVGIINQGTRKISARWPQTVFYFCPCQVHRRMRPRTNTSSLTRDTFLCTESFISSVISGELMFLWAVLLALSILKTLKRVTITLIIISIAQSTRSKNSY